LYVQIASIEGGRQDLAQAIGRFLFHRWLKSTTPGRKAKGLLRKAKKPTAK